MHNARLQTLSAGMCFWPGATVTRAPGNRIRALRVIIRPGNTGGEEEAEAEEEEEEAEEAEAAAEGAAEV